MKLKIKLRVIAQAILFAIAATCFLCAFSTGKSVKSTYADASVFAMADGGSIRADDHSGLRFQVAVDENTVNDVNNNENKTFGAFIIPSDKFEEKNVSKASGTDYVTRFSAVTDFNFSAYCKEGLSVSTVKDKDCNYTIACSFTDLYYKNIHRDYFGMFYIKTVDESNKATYQYATFNEGENERSVDLVAFRETILNSDSENLSLCKSYTAQGYLLGTATEDNSYANAEALTSAANTLVSDQTEYAKAEAYFKQNSITQLNIENWTYGATASIPTAKAKYGKVSFTYSDSENGTYTETVPTNAGTYYVKASVEQSNIFDGASQTKSFVVNKATVNLTAAPTAKTNLTFSNKDQTLANAGTVGNGGKIQYSLDNSTWSDSVVTGKLFKDYTVYYKVVLTDETNYQLGQNTTGSFTATIQGDPGNVTYFDTLYIDDNNNRDLFTSLSNAYAWSATGTKYGKENYSLLFNAQSVSDSDKYRGTVCFKPFITDLNVKDSNGDYLYNYLYFLAKPLNADNVKVSFNSNDNNAFIELVKGEWNLILIRRSRTGFVVATQNEKDQNVFSNGSKYNDVAVSVNDITGFSLRVKTTDTLDSGSYCQVCFSTIRAVKELTDTDMAKNEGNLTFFDRGVGSDISDCGGNGWNTSINTHYGSEFISFCIYFGNTYKINSCITNLNEKDINGDYLYNYVYFYAKANGDNMKIAFNASDYVSLTKGEWILIKIEREGETFKYNGKDVFASGYDSPSTMKTFKLRGDGGQICISAIRAVKAMPTESN